MAIAGLVFAGLFVLGWALLHQRPPLNASDHELIDYFADPAHRRTSRRAGLYVVPFAAIAFIWFMAALRARYVGAGGRENALLSTAHIMAGALFVAALFLIGAVELAMAWMVDTADEAAVDVAAARACSSWFVANCARWSPAHDPFGSRRRLGDQRCAEPGRRDRCDRRHTCESLDGSAIKGDTMSTSTTSESDQNWSLLDPREPNAARTEAGRRRRDAVPLEAHAELVVPPSRASALSILRAEDANRVQELVPIRYGRMLATPFTYLRGSAGVMATDLAAGPRTDLQVHLCGDAHLSNFGVFRSPEQRLVIDVNDFDETLPGPFEWDVKRLAASIVVAGRNNRFDPKFSRKTARAATAAYRSAIQTAAAMNPLDLFYFELDANEVISELKTSKAERKRFANTRKKAERKNSLGALHKLTDVVDGRRQIVSNPPLIVALRGEQRDHEMARVQTFFDDYCETLNSDRRQLLERYALIDIARKVVGVGSVGTRCLIALFETGDGEPLFLQVKEAGASVLEQHLEPSGFDQEGRRVVAGQRSIQATPDAFLGWARWQPPDRPAIDFYVRQLWNGKASADVETMTPNLFEHYARTCGSALGRAHARSGDAAMISGYLGDDDTFDRAIARFAEAYADRTEQDYDELMGAVDGGQVPIVRDL